MTRALVLIAILAVFVPLSAAARVFDFVENENLDFDFSTRKGLRLRIEEPDIQLRLGGRLLVDADLAQDDATPIQKFDADVRRGRLYLSGRLFEKLRFKVEREFAPSRKGWRNVWLGYAITRGLSVKVGNVVAPFGLEQVVSSNYSTFMERATSSELAPSFQTGVRLNSNGHFGPKRSRNRWTASIAGLMEPLGQKSDDQHRSEHYGVASRLTYAPIAQSGRVVHFGTAVEYRDVRNNSGYRIASRPEAGLVPEIVSTGLLADVDSVLTVGAEAAGILGSLTLQGEYMHSFLQRSQGREDPSFGGGYVQASYVLTGEKRLYSPSSGTIGGVKPTHKWGALELGVRFSTLDLNDETVNGGRIRDWTVGANWYLRENVRFMFNYVHVDAEQKFTRVSDDPDIAEFRFQIFF